MQSALKEYTYSIEVSRPREKVVEYFFDPDMIKKFQKLFTHIEMVSGTYMEERSVANVYYGSSKDPLIVRTAIRKNRLPDLMICDNFSKHVDYEIANRFIENRDGSTQCRVQVRVMAVRGLFMKFYMRFFPNHMKKLGVKELKKFKSFVEAGN